MAHRGHRMNQVPNEQAPSPAPSQAQYSVQEDAVKKLRKREHLAEALHLAAEAYALYKDHQIQKDPANAEKLEKEKHMAESAALGLAGCALYERHGADKLERSEGHQGKSEKKRHHFSK